MSPCWKQRLWKESTEYALLESLLADLNKLQKGHLKLSSILARTLPDFLGPENLIATVANHGRLCLVETGSGRVVREQQLGHGSLSSVAFAPNSEQLAICSGDGCLCLVETGSGRVVREQQLGHGSLWSVAFAPNSEQLAICSGDGCLFLVETGSGRVVREQQLGHGPLRSVAFAPNSEQLAICSRDGCLCLVETGSGRVVREQQLGHGSLWSVAFAPNSEQLAICSGDGCLFLVETGSGRVVREQQLGHGRLSSVAFAPEARNTQCAQNNVSRFDPRAIEDVHHWNPPVTISEGEATTLVEQQWSSWVDFLNEVQPEELFTAYDVAPSEASPVNGAVGKPLEYGEKVFLINLSRVVPEYQRAMRLGRDLEPVRTALEEFGHRSCIDPPGAHVFVQPVQYMAVRDLCRTVDLKPHHIIISHTFVPLLLDALRSLPSKKHVRIRSMSPLAIVSDGSEHLIIVEKTFFVQRSQNQRSPRSVTQSSGVAHGIDNPRRSA